MPPRTALPILLTALATVTACQSGPEPLPVDTMRTWDLRFALQDTDVDPVGVTVNRESGRVFFLDEQRGLYEVLEDETIEEVMSLEDFPAAEIAPTSAFTDLAVISDTMFALTARSDGYLLDLEEGTLT
ncbi:MAG: hypothetical protein GY898_17510 [Proteobacteria bacterium]|nr:hypothetical protein [Pseudomonadota bacterium]